MASLKTIQQYSNQLNQIEKLDQFYNLNFNKSFLKKIFSKKNSKLGFYLQGDVGVGKTMILNFFFENLNHPKQRLHFNEFMINFHDFVFKNKKNNKENVIDKFVSKLKTKFKIEDVPIVAKIPKAINDDGTCTYIILTESPCI